MLKNQKRASNIARKQELRKKSKGKISIKDVALIFGLSVKQMRTYKMLGIIRPIETKGRRDLYDLEKMREVKAACEKYHSERIPLPQIAEEVKPIYEGKEVELKLVKPEDNKAIILKITEDLQKGFKELEKGFKELTKVVPLL